MKIHFRRCQDKPAWTPCGIHTRMATYGYSAYWEKVTCNSCRRWARQLLDGIEVANGRKARGNAGWPSPSSEHGKEAGK